MGFSQSKEIWLLSRNPQLTVLLTQVSCTCIYHFVSCITGMSDPVITSVNSVFPSSALSIAASLLQFIVTDNHLAV